MTGDAWDDLIADLQDKQVEVCADKGIIFTMSLSASQVRIEIVTYEQQVQSFFIYRHTDEQVGQKVLRRIERFLSWVRQDC